MATRKQHAIRIAAAWQKAVPSIIETGQRLQAAFEDLRTAEFEVMVQEELPFGLAAAWRIKAVGIDKRLLAHALVLPPSWYTLYEIHLLSDAQFKRGIKEGIIRPDMERKDLDALRRRKAGEPLDRDDFDEATSSINHTLNLLERLARQNPRSQMLQDAAVIASKLQFHWATTLLEKMAEPPLRIAK